MPEQVSVQEFARKIRERRPDLAHIPDITLVGKTLHAAPNLREYVDMSQLPGMDQPPSNAPDDRTAFQVASDQAANVIKGIPQAITGIPSALGSLYDVGKNALTGNFSGAASGAGQMVKGALSPLTTSARGAGALIAPNSVGAPNQQEWEGAAQGAGAMLGAAELPNLLSGVKAGVSRLGRVAQNKLTTAPNVNKWMGSSPKEMEYGADPGMRIKSEKLLGKNKEATLKNVEPTLNDSGAKLQAHFDAAEQQGVRFNANPAVEDAIQNATKRYGLKTDEAFRNQLSNIYSEIVDEFPDIENLTPTRAHELTSRLGDSTKWHGSPFEGDLNQVFVKARSAITKDLKTQIPGVADELSRWGDLYQASKSLKKGMTADRAGQGTGNAAPGSLRKIGTKAVKVGAYGSAGIGGAAAIYNTIKN